MSGMSLSRPSPFRTYLVARTIATVGDQAAIVGLAFSVLVISKHASDLGVVLAAQILPEALLVLVGGAVADRWDRRRLMLVTDVVRGFIQLFTGLLVLTHTASILELVLLQASYGAATAFFTPSSLGFVAELVDPPYLEKANALVGISYSVSLVAGPGMAGVLVAVGSPGTAVLIDAGSFFVSAFGFLRLLDATARSARGGSLLQTLRGGWSEFTRSKWVWVLVCLWAFYQATVLAAYLVLGPLVAAERLGGAGVWGTVLASQGVGAAVAGTVALKLRPARPLVVILFVLLFDIPLLLCLAVSAPEAFLLLAGFLEGAALSYASIVWVSVLQARIPLSSLSRVFSYDQLGSISMRPVGLVVVGFVAGSLGSGRTLLFIASAHVAALIIVLSVRAVRDVSNGKQDGITRSDQPEANLT